MGGLAECQARERGPPLASAEISASHMMYTFWVNLVLFSSIWSTHSGFILYGSQTCDLHLLSLSWTVFSHIIYTFWVYFVQFSVIWTKKTFWIHLVQFSDKTLWAYLVQFSAILTTYSEFIWYGFQAYDLQVLSFILYSFQQYETHLLSLPLNSFQPYDVHLLSLSCTVLGHMI